MIRSQLKKQFLEVDGLRSASGFGWDEALQMVTATEGVWEPYIKVALCSRYCIS